MKKCSYFNNLVKLCLGGVLTCIVSLVITSCDNFLSGGDVKAEIEQAIAYKNAKEISALIQPEVGTGITVPSGDYTFKLGYDFEVNFTADSSYSFIKWIVVSKENPDTSAPISEGIVFEDETKPNTKVKITNDTTALRLIPLCVKRIAVSEESPKYESQGVSRDRPIIVSFSKELLPDSFIFSEAEIPEGAVTKSDENNKIWAYTLNGETYLKNIKITNDADYSIAEHFLKPEVNGKLLTISVNKSNPIQFETNGVLKVVKVTLSGQIKDAAGIPMSSEKSWNYQINDSTVEKASVNFFSTAAEGQISAVSKEYSIGQKIAVSFTEGIDYQFVKWEYDPSLIHIEDDDAKRPSTTITVLGISDSTQVRAVCVPRLRLESASPAASTATAVAKNSSIILSFNQNLPDTEEARAQLERIQITVNGDSVRSNFNAPVVNGKNINFIADKANMIDVPAGQTKIVTVSIPSEFYYLLDDGTKVTYGGNGKTFSYKIDETTVTKASVNFVTTQAAGQINAVSKEYSIGQKIALSFTESADYQFIKWTYDNKYIQLENPKAPSTTVTILENTESEATKVTAVCAPRLRLESSSPAASTASSVAKNSSIILSFNQNLPVTEAALAQLEKIQISVNGESVRANFNAPVVNGKNINFIADRANMIDVGAGQTKNVTVSIPADFYYLLEDGTKVTYGGNGKTFSYKIDDTTVSKASVNFVSGQSEGQIGAVSGAYSIGQKIALSFSENPDYQFIKWTYDNKIVRLENTASPSTTVTILENTETEATKVTAVCAPRLRLTLSDPADSTASAVAKNSSITLSFNQNLPVTQEALAQLEKIQITIGGSSVRSSFKAPVINEKTITFEAENSNMIDVAAGQTKIVTVSIPSDFYYLLDDGTKITHGGNGKTLSYKINDETESKAGIKIIAEDGSGTVSGISSQAESQYSIEQEVPLVFNVNNGYIFTGWSITKGDPAIEVPESEIKITDKNASSTKMYIHEAISGVTVKANTLELPAVSTNSQTSELIKSDRPITATFNMEMDETQFDYTAGKITIRCGTDDVSSCFKPASFTEDKKTITLLPNGTALYDYARAKNAAQITVNVTFSNQLTVTRSSNGKDFTLPLLQNDKSSFSVRYLAQVESTKPTHYALYATAKAIDLDNAVSNSAYKFTDLALANFGETEILQNETNGPVYIYGKYRDEASSDGEASGVEKVLLTVRHTNKKDGTELSATADSYAFTKQLDGTWQSPQGFTGTAAFSETDGYTEFVIRYDILTGSSAINSDGAYLFTVQVSDACKNAAGAKSFTAIKDSYIDISGVDVSNLTGSTPKDITVTYTKPVYKNVIKTEGLKYTYSCYNTNGTKVYESSAISEPQHTLGVGDVTDLKLNVTVTDEFGNQATKDFFFPPKPHLSDDGSYITIEEGLNNVTAYEVFVYDYSYNPHQVRSILEFPYEKGNKNNQIIYSNKYFWLKNYSLDECYFVNHKLKGESVSLNNEYTENLISKEDLELPEVTIDWEKLVFDEGSDSEATVYYKISLNKNNYDKVWVNIVYRGNKFYFTSNLFESGKKELSACSRNAWYFCQNENCEVWLFVEKNHEYRVEKIGTTDPGKNGLFGVRTPNVQQNPSTWYKSIVDGFMSLGIPNVFDYFSCTKDGMGTDYHEYMKISVNTVEWIYNHDTLQLSSDCFKIPVWDFDTEEENITFTQTNTAYNGKSGSGTFTLPHFAKGSIYYAPKVEITRKNDSTLTLKTTEPIANNNAPHFYVTKINSTNSDAWQVHQNSGSDEWNFENNSAEHKTDGYYFSKEIPFAESNNVESNNAALDKAFLKVVSSPHNENRPEYLGPYNFSAPTIFYTGTKGSGNYDLLMKNGQSTSTLAVQSDAPVFVHTLVTKKPYSECKNWSAEKWEYLHKHIGEKYLDFSSTEHTARRYNIPVNQIDSGDCYVVIAHFSDNHTEMSEVMVK